MSSRPYRSLACSGTQQWYHSCAGTHHNWHRYYTFRNLLHWEQDIGPHHVQIQKWTDHVLSITTMHHTGKCHLQTVPQNYQRFTKNCIAPSRSSQCWPSHQHCGQHPRCHPVHSAQCHPSYPWNLPWHIILSMRHDTSHHMARKLLPPMWMLPSAPQWQC